MFNDISVQFYIYTEEFSTLCAGMQTGRPIGSVGLIGGLEAKYDRVLKPGKQGTKGNG